MSDVFLSYRNTPERRAIVRRLAFILHAHGIDVWWDYGLEAGEDYREQIMAALKASQVVTPLWCEQSVVSRWVLKEAEIGGDKLIPARLQNVPPPAAFEAVQSANLIGWDGAIDHPGVARLVADIRRRLGKVREIPLDAIEELRLLPHVSALPEPVVTVRNEVVDPAILGALRAEWEAFQGKHDLTALRDFSSRASEAAPGSTLAFEVEHVLTALKATVEREAAIRIAQRKQETEQCVRFLRRRAHQSREDPRAFESAILLADVWRQNADSVCKKIDAAVQCIVDQNRDRRGDLWNSASSLADALIPLFQDLPLISMEEMQSPVAAVLRNMTDRKFTFDRMDWPPTWSTVSAWFPAPLTPITADMDIVAGSGSQVAFCVRPGLVQDDEVMPSADPAENEGYPRRIVYLKAQVLAEDSYRRDTSIA